MDHSPNLGSLLATLRRSLGLSQVAMAREVRISRNTLRAIEDGSGLGSQAARAKLTAWALQRGLVLRSGEPLFSALIRAHVEDEVARSVGRLVGAGLDRCPKCGAKLEAE